MPSRRQAAAAVLAATAAACSGPGTADDRTDGDGGSSAGVAGEVLVSAAASLTDAFTEMASAFEAAHPDADVVLNLGGSSSLRAQILEGAPVDVFAPASPGDMDRVVAAGRASERPDVFARNRLRIAVPAGNPARVEGLEDFADEALHLGLCAEEVPCGELAHLALRRAGVVPALDTNEPNVRALLTKVELGELDAGITYATDVVSARGSVDGIDIPADVNVVAEYLVAVLAPAPNPGAARAFVRFVLSDEGRAILAKHGFGPP